MKRTYKNPCKDCVLFVKCSTPCKELINLQNIVARKVYDVCYSNDTGYAQCFDAKEIDSILTEIAEEFIQPKKFKSVTITTDQVGVELIDGKIVGLIKHPIK